MTVYNWYNRMHTTQLVHNMSDLLFIGMNTYSLLRTFIWKNFSADVIRTILKIIAKDYVSS